MEETIIINTEEIKKENNREVLKEIFDALEERGYNAYKQITEYILTGEVGYISSYKNSRDKITTIDRRDLVELMLKEFIK